jgi:hypothetical protein
MTMYCGSRVSNRDGTGAAVDRLTRITPGTKPICAMAYGALKGPRMSQQMRKRTPFHSVLRSLSSSWVTRRCAALRPSNCGDARPSSAAAAG